MAVEALRERLEDASERLREKTRAYNEATAARDEIEREVRQLRARRDRLREQGAAEAFVPGSDPEAATTVAEDEQLTARIEEAATRIEELGKEKEQAREEQQEAARNLARALAGRVGEAEERRVDALARLGSAVLPAFAAYLDAASERGEVETELKQAVGTAAATPQQRHRLKNHLRQEAGEVPPEALIGRVLADALNWLRRLNDGPVPALLETEDISLAEGSCRHHPPVAGVEGLVACLEDGRLPSPPNI